MLENLKKTMERNREAVSYRLGKSRMERKMDALAIMWSFSTAILLVMFIIVVTPCK